MDFTANNKLFLIDRYCNLGTRYLSPQNASKSHGQSHLKFKTKVPVAPRNGFKSHGKSHPKSKTGVPVAPQNCFKSHGHSHPKSKTGYQWLHEMALNPVSSHPKSKKRVPVAPRNAFNPMSRCQGQNHPNRPKSRNKRNVFKKAKKIKTKSTVQLSWNEYDQCEYEINCLT